MNNGPYLVFGEAAFTKIDTFAEDWIRIEFYDLAAELVNNSRPAGSLPTKGVPDDPPSFTAPFDDGFVPYVVRPHLDPPEIELGDPVWVQV